METSIFTWIKKRLSPPVFEGNQEKSEKARLLNVTLLAVLALLIVGYSLLIFLQPEEAPLHIAIALILGTITMTNYAVMRSGRVEQGGVMLTLMMWLAVTLLPVTAGSGLFDPVLSGYFLVVALAFVFIGDRAALIFSGASITALLGMYILQLGETEIPVASTPSVNLLILASMLCLVVFLFRYIIRQLQFALERARRNEQAQIEANQALSVTNTQLLEIRATLEQRATWEQATVQKYVAYMAEVGQGNLIATMRLEPNGKQEDPLLILGHSLIKMTGNLQAMSCQLRDAAVHLSTVTTELSAATAQQLTAASEQTSAIAETVATIEEIKSIADLSLQKAQGVAEQSRRVTEVSKHGQQAVAQSAASMEQIRDKVAGIAGHILALSEQNQKVGEIIGTVNDLASQSNLLALNASVEAARAGEHGRGFAVVAVEVRKLAEQSRQATAQVRTILNDIQRATNASVLATEEGTKGVDNGSKLVKEAGATIQQLLANIGESVTAAQQILASTQQQTTGMEQIAQAMQHINAATVQNLNSTRQTERAAQQLSGLATQMEGLVGRYQLGEL